MLRVVTPEARVASDPNLTIECLMRTLKQVEQSDGYLPPNLCLQFDNCFRGMYGLVVYAPPHRICGHVCRKQKRVRGGVLRVVGGAWCVSPDIDVDPSCRSHT